MKKALSLLLLTFSLTAVAQEVEITDLQLQVRGDYQNESIDGNEVKDATGFRGKYLNFIIKGNLGEKFNFAYRQRLNRASYNKDFFDATDWLYLDYKATRNLTLSAGKQIVAIGGYEYDRAPIDVYFATEYWNNISPYQWGVSATLGLPKHNDFITAQFCQSPFRRAGQKAYAYNLFWAGHHGLWSTLWSVNAIEHRQGRFITYVSLGNSFDLGRFGLELDLMSRSPQGGRFPAKDLTIVGELGYSTCPCFRLFAKASYDVNRSNIEGDDCVLRGTEITRVGGGLEYFPLKNKTVRLHADAAYSFGKNSNPVGALVDKQLFVNAGVTWNVNLLNARLKK